MIVLISSAVKKRKGAQADAGTTGFFYVMKKRKYPYMDVCFSGPIGVGILYGFALIFAVTFIEVAIEYWNGKNLEVRGVAAAMIMLITLLVMVVVCAYAGRLIQQRYVYFDETKLVVGRLIDADLTLEWNEIQKAYVRVGNSKVLYLLDWNDRMCCFAKAGMQNFYAFYDTVMRKVPDTEMGRDMPEMESGMDMISKRKTAKLFAVVIVLLGIYVMALLIRSLPA